MMILRMRRRTKALNIPHPILLLCLLLCCNCQASSPHDATNINGRVDVVQRGSVNDAIDNDAIGIDDIDGNNDDEIIESVISRLSSWMKLKHKKNAKLEKKLAGEDFLLRDDDDDGDDGDGELLPLLNRKQPLPFVTLAYAQTLDGMIAAKNQQPTTRSSETSSQWATTTTSNMKLSSTQSMTLTHRLRAMHDAILVGGSTFLTDAPRLNVRLNLNTPSSTSPSYSPTTNNHHHQRVISMDQPLPVVLDTNLNHLQKILFGKIVSSSNINNSDDGEEEILLPDISIDKIKAHNPIICCSPNATQSFLDVLEVFQYQQSIKKPKHKKNSYKITVYKKIDDEYDHEHDFLLPVKITIRVISHHKKEEDTMRDVTLTLLPCLMMRETTTRINTRRIAVCEEQQQQQQLDVRGVLCQLYNQFGIGSVMVEGGAGILSSFMNACMEDHDDGGVGGSSSKQRHGKVVDCICATIVPKVIGGKWGLPVLGGLDAMPDHNSEGRRSDVRDSDGDDIVDDDGGDESLLPMMSMKDGKFVSLGPDCIFLGRI